MSRAHDLQLAMLALEQNWISHDQFLAGVASWSNTREASLIDLLEAAGALSTAHRAELDTLARARSTPDVNGAIDATAAIPGEPGSHPTVVRSTKIDATISHSPSSAHPPNLLNGSPSAEQNGGPVRFEILHKHAQGGLGTVYVARDLELNREVALKEIQARFADDISARARFTLEAEITGALEHPGIVPVYGLGTHYDGRPFYAMRFIKGDSLKEAIARFHGTSEATAATARTDPFRDSAKQLELRQLLGRFVNVCQAIEYAHSRGVLHRDLKPSNIMLGKYGETLVVDWGLAKARGRADLPHEPNAEAALTPSSGSSIEPTQMGSAIGTLAYMSPEQACGRLDVLGPPTDIFSLGATLFHLLTGRPPLEDARDDVVEALRIVQDGELPTAREVFPGVPRGLDAICRRAMALEPSDRYQSAQALGEDVERWLGDEAVHAAPDSMLERATRWGRKHKGWVQAGSLAVVLLALVATAAALLVNAQRQVAESLADQNSKLADQRRAALEQEHIERAGAEKARNAAVAAQGVAEVAKDDAQAAKRQAERQLAESYLDRGRTLCDQKDVHYGLLWMARGLAVLPPDSPEMERAIRANLAAWLPRMHTAVLAVPQGSQIHGVAYSPSGEHFATACNGGQVRIWSATTGEPTAFHAKHEGAVKSVAFSPDGKLLASGGYDNAVRIWDAITGAPVGKPCMHELPVNCVAFNPQGTRVAVGFGQLNGGGLRMWDVASCEPVDPKFETSGVFSVAFAPDGKRLVTGSFAANDGRGTGSVQIWDAETGQRIGADLRQRFRTVGAAFSPDGKSIAAASVDTTACVWDAAAGYTRFNPIRHPGTCNAIAFSPDSQRLLTGADSGHAFLWDARSGERIGPAMTCGVVRAVAFSPDGTQVLAGGDEEVAWIWKTAAAEPERQLLTTSRGEHGLGVTHDNKNVLVGSQVFDLKSKQPVGARFAPQPGYLGLALAPDNQHVLLSSKQHETYTYNFRTGERIGQPLKHEERISTVAYGPDGQRVATGSFDGTAQIWEARTGSPVGSRIKVRGRLWSVAFHPDGKLLGTSNDDGLIELWDAETAAAVGEPIRCPQQVFEIAFHPDGGILAMAGQDRCVRFWDLKQRQFLPGTLPHGGPVARVRYSADGALLVTGCFDSGLRLWDSATGKQIGPTYMHVGPAMAIAISPDSQTIVSGTEYANVYLWPVWPAVTGSATEIAERLATLGREELAPSGEPRMIEASTWLQQRAENAAPK